MCWNAKASITAFILGTLFNIISLIYFKNKIMTSVCIFWQWVLCIQLAEYFIWSNPKNNTLGTNMAFIITITQPIFLFLVSICVFQKQIPPTNLIIASLIILIYISIIIYSLNKLPEYKNTTKSLNCSHLNFKWWKDMEAGGKAYVLTVILLLFLFFYSISPKITIFILLYVIGSLIISSVFYSCGAPSMWCFLAVPFPLILGLFQKYLI